VINEALRSYEQQGSGTTKKLKKKMAPGKAKKPKSYLTTPILLTRNGVLSANISGHTLYHLRCGFFFLLADYTVRRLRRA